MKTRTKNTHSDLQQDGFMRIDDVLSTLAVSRSTLYRMIEEGKIPKPIKVGKRMSRWQRYAIHGAIDRLAADVVPHTENKT